MQIEIILAGFGGQGIMFAGQILSYASMDTGNAKYNERARSEETRLETVA